ncbi:hypothetical protein M5K25_003780 [Dendrobium thyrsiflorum]|uniref:Uncharacterized protein n=1 Tax=Dendrobium thyrsiflorum TaxID=117978 RepID=A0ABD0VLG8_DENTH
MLKFHLGVMVVVEGASSDVTRVPITDSPDPMWVLFPVTTSSIPVVQFVCSVPCVLFKSKSSISLKNLAASSISLIYENFGELGPSHHVMKNVYGRVEAKGAEVGVLDSEESQSSLKRYELAGVGKEEENVFYSRYFSLQRLRQLFYLTSFHRKRGNRVCLDEPQTESPLSLGIAVQERLSVRLGVSHAQASGSAWKSRTRAALIRLEGSHASGFWSAWECRTRRRAARLFLPSRWLSRTHDRH